MEARNHIVGIARVKVVSGIQHSVSSSLNVKNDRVGAISYATVWSIDNSSSVA